MDILGVCYFLLEKKNIVERRDLFFSSSISFWGKCQREWMEKKVKRRVGEREIYLASRNGPVFWFAFVTIPFPYSLLDDAKRQTRASSVK
jgi:hypothetical protein